MVANTTETYTKSQALESLADMIRANPDGFAILDHGSRTPDELASDVIRVAISMGWQDAKAASYVDLYESGNHPPEDWVQNHYSLSEALADCAYDASDSAEDYLNDCLSTLSQNAMFPYDSYWFGNDGEVGAFGCWYIGDED